MVTSTATDDVTVSAPQLGKTIGLGMWLLAGAWLDSNAERGWPSWWTAPTYEQAHHGYTAIVDMARSAGVLYCATTRPPLRAHLSNGAVIEGRSWDRPDGLYGPTVGRIAVDEFGFLTTEAYAALRSRVAETRVHSAGFMRFAGNVGEVGGEAEAIWMHAQSGAPGWAARTWTWRDRAEAAACSCATGEPIAVVLDRDTTMLHAQDCERRAYLTQLLDVKARMSDLHFRQLYGAEWLDWSALPAYTFDRGVHVTADVHEEPSLPLDLSCDFNVDPMCWVIGQHTATEAWALDEIVIPGGATTQAACAEFLRRRPGTTARDLLVFGDASGSARGTKSTKSDYQIIQQEIAVAWPRLRLMIPPANGPVTERLNAVNAMLRNGEGEVRYYLHPRCTRLATDFARVGLKPGTRDIDKSNRNLTHPSDAEGYRLVRLFPVRSVSCVVRGGMVDMTRSENPAYGWVS